MDNVYKVLLLVPSAMIHQILLLQFPQPLGGSPGSWGFGQGRIL